MQFGHYGDPAHTLVHLSDTHLLADGEALYGRLQGDDLLERGLRRLVENAVRPDAIVFTGDLADRAEADAYHRLRSRAEPVAREIGAELVWVMGNHDDRRRFRAGLLDTDPGDAEPLAPVDTVFDLNGLRLIVLDSSVPGYDHGELTNGQLAWLRDVLAEPARHGSVIAMHHPPIPIRVEAMTILELQDQEAFAEVVRGSDVRAVLAGHLHYSSWSTFAGVPVSVAASTCYTLDAGAPARVMRGVDGAQAFNLVHAYGDRIVHSVVPVAAPEVLYELGEDFVARMGSLDAEGRREAFGRHAPD